MLSDAIEHVKSCPICMGKGFVCEFCHNSNDIMFPFEVGRVVSCESELNSVRGLRTNVLNPSCLYVSL